MLRWLLKKKSAEGLGDPVVKTAEEQARRMSEGLEQHRAGRLREAQALYEQVLEREAQHIDALHFLGVIAYQRGELGRAEELILRALSRQEANAAAQNNLGNVLEAQGRVEQARERFEKAIQLQPDYVDAYLNLGGLWVSRGELQRAESCYERGLEAVPGSARLHAGLGGVRVKQGRVRDAVSSYERALDLEPGLAEVHSNLGNVLRDQGRLEAAIGCYERALALRPQFAEAHYNLGNVLKDVGRLEEALRSYREAMALAPQDAETRSNFLCALNYVGGLRPAEIYAEHLEYARRFCPPVAAPVHGNARDPGRRLRIGYVSGDLRTHPVAQFFEPVLAQHDRERCEIFCYYNYPNADAVTERLRARADRWRNVFALDDDALARQIREDAVDVLIDLSGHTGNNRLPVFARRPAPVQASWLGYLNTTGLEALDYRITDRYASPQSFDALHSERLLRLPDSQWCYQAPENCPEVAPPPSRASGFVTFGAFANLAKIGPQVIDTWCRLLERVPSSRLLVMGPGLASIREQYLARFTGRGVPASRIELREASPFHDYLRLHDAVDVMLDTFPYAGGTSSCHALWMGVPVITLVGDTAPSRSGASLLHVIGLEELVARTTEQYLEIACGLAASPERLATLRSGMRARMASSALMDAKLFTRNLERAYRSMWEAWCKGMTEASATAR
jgi:protein O-GlcNAc transferase